MSFQIDVGVQTNDYVFRLNPKTLKLLGITNVYVPSCIELSFDSLPEFDELYKRSQFVRMIPIALSGLSLDKIKNYFDDIVFYDVINQKNLYVYVFNSSF